MCRQRLLALVFYAGVESDMPRTLKEGFLPSERIFICDCVNCGGKFEFKATEAVEIIDDRDGTMHKFKCPTTGCNRDLWGYGKGEIPPALSPYNQATKATKLTWPRP